MAQGRSRARCQMNQGSLGSLPPIFSRVVFNDVWPRDSNNLGLCQINGGKTPREKPVPSPYYRRSWCPSPTVQCSWTEPKFSGWGAGCGGFGSVLFVTPPSSSCWLVFRVRQTHFPQALPLSRVLPAPSHLSRPLLDPFHFLGILCEGGQRPQRQHTRQSLANPK